MAGLLCDSRNEKRDVTADWMDKTQDTSNLLETVEKDMAEIQEPQAAGDPSQGRVAMGKQQARMLAYSQNVDTDHLTDQQIPRLAGI